MELLVGMPTLVLECNKIQIREAVYLEEASFFRGQSERSLEYDY